jgi:hypothetical protein
MPSAFMIRSSFNHPRNTCLTGLVELNLNLLCGHLFSLVKDLEVHSSIFTIHSHLVIEPCVSSSERVSVHWERVDTDLLVQLIVQSR